MVKFSSGRIEELKENFKGKKIAVVGDMMLDCYFRGEVTRISPEAPVPVIEVQNEFFRFGGAANVALNVLKLGGIPYPVGVIGDDNDGAIFKSLIEQSGINNDGIIVDKQRPTTAKTRIIAHTQHLVRIDKESKESISSEVKDHILSFIKMHLSDFDAIILEDYNKGVLIINLIEEIISTAKHNDILITVDPKFNNFFSYKNVNVFKPNRKEAEDVLGMKIVSPEDISYAGKKILELLNADNVLLTLGAEGIAVFEKGKPEKRMSTKARKVADVSGAGDTVISTLTMAMAAGANILEASYLANYAGGLVCEEVGIVPIDFHYLFDTIMEEVS